MMPIGFITPALIYVTIQYFKIVEAAKKSYHEQTKKHLLKFLLDNFENIRINKETEPTENEIKIFDINNKYKYDDSYTGKYKDTEFKFSEIYYVSSFDERYSEKNDGIIGVFEFNKPIYSETQIIDKNTDYNKNFAMCIIMIIFGAFFLTLTLMAAILIPQQEFRNTTIFDLIPSIIMLWVIADAIIKLIKLRTGKGKISLEDTEFEKYFKVNSDDEIESRYLITTSFMERFLRFKKVFSAKSIDCAFKGTKFIIFMKTDKDLFEIGDIFKPLNDKNSIRHFYYEISTIYRLIDYFKLNERTGL